MAYDIGPRIGIDGEAEFRRQLRTVNESIKTMGAEMEAVTSAFIGAEDSVEALTAKNEVLGKTITAQEDKIARLREGVEKATAKFGKVDENTLKWQRALNEATAKLNKMKAELSQTEQALEDFNDGTKESDARMKNLDQKLKTLNSELRLVDSALKDGADAEEQYARKAKILNEQIDTQEEKIEQLRRELDRAADKFGEMDTKTLRWRQELNNATAELGDMKRALEKAEKGIDDLGDSTDKTGFSFDDLSGIMKGGFAAGAVGAVVAGAKELTEAMMELVDETQEYRTIMASLESSSQAAGYTAEQTTETYRQLLGVLGDTQTAATATANLQAIGLNQSQLTEITNAAIGAWARYGDSIPIDGLAEAINETIKVGQVTGTFADVLNWAGISEDEFNTRLQEVNGSAERANIVLKLLSDEGLAQAGEAWRMNNAEIVAYNESQDEFDSAMAELGAVLAPAAAAIKSFGADAIKWLTGVLQDAIAAADAFIDRIEEMDKKGKDVNKGVLNYGAYIDGSHASGLDYVPFDGYVAELHRGEMVLPAPQADLMRSGAATGNGAELATIAAAVVNGMQSVISTNAGAEIRLITPEGTELARYMLPGLIAVADAAGTPIIAK